MKGEAAEAMKDMPTDCVEFDGARNEKGYGRISRGGKVWLHHRYIWTVANGPIPKGMCVLHRCDNPACYRLAHLFLGTQADNNRDMSEKGRNHQQRKSHCPEGHPYSGSNLIDRGHDRLCRACQREAKRRWKARNSRRG